MDVTSLQTTNLPAELVAAIEAAPFSATIRRYELGSWTVVEVDGDLDIQGVPSMRDHLIGDPSHLLFDLTRVPFMDASMLGVMVSSWRLATQSGGSVCIVAPSHQVRRLLTITRLDQIIPTFATVGAAMGGALECRRDTA